MKFSQKQYIFFFFKCNFSTDITNAESINANDLILEGLAKQFSIFVNFDSDLEESGKISVHLN